MSLKKIFSYSLLLLCTGLLFGVNENAGTTGFNNLKIIYSARAMGMARAMTGICGTIDGLQFNPAATLNPDGRNAAFTYSSYLVDTNGGAVQILFPDNEHVTYGVFLNYLNAGEMDRTEVTSDNEYLETGQTFGANDIIAGVSTSRYVNPSIDLGLSLKYIHDQIDTYSASAILIDAGLIHHPVNKKITVGISMLNLGRQLTYYTSDKYMERLPFTFGAGLSYQLHPKLLAAFDISKPRGANLTAKVGVEYKVHPLLDLRAGYNNNAPDWKTGGDLQWTSGLTFGAGFHWKEYKLDYGLASYGNLGFVNQVTLAYKF